MTAITLTLDMIPLGPDRESTSGYACPACHDRLTLHQPEVLCPDRLLGTCSRCGAWFAVHPAGGLMVRLPEEHDLRCSAR